MSDNKSRKKNIQAEAGNPVKKGVDVKKIMADILEWIKANRDKDALILFAIFELAVILVGILAMKEPVVPVCLIVIAAAGIAALMHNVELWIHGVVVLVELIAGILIRRIPLMVLCIVVYIVTIVTLKYYYMERNKKHGQ